MLPYSLGASLASMPAAWYISYRQRKTSSTKGQKEVIFVGLAVATTGFGASYFDHVLNFLLADRCDKVS